MGDGLRNDFDTYFGQLAEAFDRLNPDCVPGRIHELARERYRGLFGAVRTLRGLEAIEGVSLPTREFILLQYLGEAWKLYGELGRLGELNSCSHWLNRTP